MSNAPTTPAELESCKLTNHNSVMSILRMVRDASLADGFQPTAVELQTCINRIAALVEACDSFDKVAKWVEIDPHYRDRPDSFLVKISVSMKEIRALSAALRSAGQ